MKKNKIIMFILNVIVLGWLFISNLYALHAGNMIGAIICYILIAVFCITFGILVDNMRLEYGNKRKKEG